MLRIGTRKSPLALAQARLVAQALGVESEIMPMSTTGDRITGPLSEEGGKGLFTKELEEALLAHRIDIAVHSAKDMQSTLPPGLLLACVPKREDVRDVLIGAASLAGLPRGAVLGSSSLRRAAQALRARPDLKIINLRGNVQTRLKKIEAGEAAATLLALAGLKRLGISVGTPLPLDEMLPAPAQGALGIECRADDMKMRELLAPLNHAPSHAAVTCERALLRTLDGNCRTPIAAYAVVENDALYLRAMLLSPDGKQCRKTELRGNALDAETLGKEAGQALLTLS